MSRTVVLDSGPLALLARRNDIPAVVQCNLWLDGSLAQEDRVILPEITDYEVRRELVRLKAFSSVKRLDNLATRIEYLPITTAAMRLAADLWAQGRQSGQPTADPKEPTADPKELDGDVILAAQALLLGVSEVVVATTNVGHLSRYVNAKFWQDV